MNTKLLTAINKISSALKEIHKEDLKALRTKVFTECLENPGDTSLEAELHRVSAILDLKETYENNPLLVM